MPCYVAGARKPRVAGIKGPRHGGRSSAQMVLVILLTTPGFLKFY